MEGDWNCDGEFDSGDFVIAFQGGDYERLAVAGAIVDSTSQSEDLTTTAEGPVVNESLRERARDLTTDGTRVEIFHDVHDGPKDGGEQLKRWVDEHRQSRTASKSV